MNLENINEDQELSNFLSASKVEDFGSQLVNRILESARQRKKKVNEFYVAIQEVVSTLTIPHPVCMLACILVIGFVIGLNDASSLELSADTVMESNDFLYNNEGVIL